MLEQWKGSLFASRFQAVVDMWGILVKSMSLPLEAAPILLTERLLMPNPHLFPNIGKPIGFSPYKLN